MGPSGDKLFACGAGHGMCIDAYGHAQPCMGIRAPELTCDLQGRRLCPCGTPLIDFPASARCVPPTRNICGAARSVFSKVCASSARQNPGPSMALSTRRLNICARWRTAQARYLGWLDENKQGWEVREWHERVRWVR